MTTLTFILTAIFLVNGWFFFTFLYDLCKNFSQFKHEKGNNIFLLISSSIIFFLSTFGISDFIISTILYRKKNIIPDTLLPGTLNTQCVIPVAAMALCFICVIEVEMKTLIVCIIAQVLGAYCGPRFIVKFSARTIRISIAIGLIIATIFIFAGLLHLMPAAGIENSLHGLKLLIAAMCLFIFGVLNNIGIGSYAPTMLTVYALGLNPNVAFPIMMGAATFSVPIGSMQFIKYGQYSRNITLFTTTFGLIGVLIAVFFVKQLDLSMLQWLVAIIVLYSGISMLINEKRLSC